MPGERQRQQAFDAHGRSQQPEIQIPGLRLEAFKAGDYVKCGDQVGTVEMDADKEGDVRVAWAAGGESIRKASELRRMTQEEYQRVVTEMRKQERPKTLEE